MRKIGILVAAAAVLGNLGAYGGIFGGEVLAACATHWEMGEKSVSFCGGTSEDGTFTAKLEGNEEDGYVSTVILKNYKGEAFYLRTYGSGFWVRKFIVELNGANEVTLPEAGEKGSEQVYIGGVTYEVIGEGKLVVKVAEPDGSGVLGGAGSSGGSGVSGGSGSSEKLPDDALIGPTEEQATGKKSAGEVTLWVVIATVALLAVAGIGFLLGRRTARGQGVMKSRRPVKKK